MWSFYCFIVDLTLNIKHPYATEDWQVIRDTSKNLNERMFHPNHVRFSHHNTHTHPLWLWLVRFGRLFVIFASDTNSLLLNVDHSTMDIAIEWKSLKMEEKSKKKTKISMECNTMHSAQCTVYTALANQFSNRAKW